MKRLNIIVDAVIAIVVGAPFTAGPVLAFAERANWNLAGILVLAIFLPFGLWLVVGGVRNLARSKNLAALPSTRYAQAVRWTARVHFMVLTASFAGVAMLARRTEPRWLFEITWQLATTANFILILAAFGLAVGSPGRMHSHGETAA